MKIYVLILCLSFTSRTIAESIKLPTLERGRTDVNVHLPRGFKKQDKWPLIISMHGYGGNATIQNYYVRLGAYNNKFGFVYAAPNGLKDKNDKGFWNASNFCCDFEKTEIDDVAYIKNLIEQISQSKDIGRIDKDRIYLIGYSNGAFLASKIACSNEVNIAGIVTISGTSDLRDEFENLMPFDKSLCEHNRAIPVLHVHGTRDETIPYEGKDNGHNGSASALSQVARWADQNDCRGSLVKVDKRLNASNFVKGKETEYFVMQECQAAVEHFKINEGPHFGIFRRKFTKAMLEFLFRGL